MHLAYRFAGKPTAKAFFKALSVFPGMPVKAAGRKVIHDIGQKIHPTEGKQSVKTLIRQGQGVSSIPLADEGMKDFQKIARKYGVDFAIVKEKIRNHLFILFSSRQKIQMPSQGFYRIILQNRSRSLP